MAASEISAADRLEQPVAGSMSKCKRQETASDAGNQVGSFKHVDKQKLQTPWRSYMEAWVVYPNLAKHADLFSKHA